MAIKNNILKSFQCFFIGLFVISFAFAFTIIFRPFYYLNISLLRIDLQANCTYYDVKEAYDDIMDYLVFGDEFKTGDFTYSEEGKQHFTDCRKIFIFDFICLFISSIYLAVIFILQKTNKIHLEYKRFSPGIYASIGIGILSCILVIWGCIDFMSLFILFHHVFFPGKTNWVFDPKLDPIVNILPTEVFINFCILIVFIIILFIVLFIIGECKRRKKVIIKKEVLQ